MTGVRGDVVTNDVFISWTGADRAVKDAVKKHLQGVFTSIESDENVICTNEGMSVTDSARDCSGNYEEWSLQAAEASHIFLLILSKNSINGSIYQPVELQAFKKIAGADYKNRIVTLCQSGEVYNSERFGEKGEHLLDKVSAVYCDFDNLSGKEFATACKDLSGKIQNLLINRAFEIHKQACLESENSLEVLSALATSAVGDRAISFDKLYIPRYVQEGDGSREDDNKEDLTPMQMLARGGVLLVHAPSGMGKTQYIKQVRRALYEEDGETYMSVLRCSDVARSNKSVYELLCEEYKGKCKVKNLNEKHFARVWETHNRLIVFDGLDEIPTIASTRNFMEKVGELDKMYCAERKMSTQFLFTSRNAADKDRISVLDKAGAHAFKLKELVEEDIESLCDKLQDTLSIRKGFYVEIQTLEDEIKTNPLLLTQLAIIYKSEGQIPDDRLDIMEKIAEIMCSLEDRADEKILRVNDIDFDGEDIRKIMEEFSAIYFEDKDSSEDSEIMAETLENLGEDLKVKYVLEYLKKRAIYSEGRYLHRNLGEYFVACRYAKSIRRSKSDDEKQKIITPVLAHCGEENWVNIINWTVRKSKITRIDIPEGVTEIPREQFKKCNSLEYITIPDSVTSVGVGAFADCNEKIFEVEDGIKYIGKWVAGCDREIGAANIREDTIGIVGGSFSNCKGLTSITIPDNVTSIGSYAFESCSQLTSITIPYSVTNIGSCAFESCSQLTSITIPDSVTNIGSWAFSDCRGLTSITISDSVTSIGECAFQNCSGLTSITISNSITSIGDWAFNGCWGLTSITIPDSVTSIGECAFQDCSGLTSITIPDSVTSIGDVAFSGCKGLTSITIPNSVTSIGKDSFKDCSRLTSITIGGSVTSIGDGAFYNCSGLKSITIPNSVTSIGDGAFYNCSGLTSITIPDNVTSIGDYAFSNCSSLTSITIPDSVTSIGDGAFSGCRSLTSITMPDGVAKIGGYAFSGCSGLTSITIPDSVTSIGGMAFKWCSGLTSITVDQGNLIYYSAGNCIIETSSKTLIMGCNNSIIPDDGSVTNIGESAFAGCSGLTSITIPDSVTSIGERAFSDCRGLASITIPDSVTSIGDDAFSGCSGLTSITIPDSVTSIGKWAFSLCRDLRSITIPDSVTSIGEWAFSNCRSLTSITIPDSVTSIGDDAFSGCSGLTSITIPDSVTSIGDRAFFGCSGLTSITIPNGVISIGKGMISYCTGLKSITLEYDNSIYYSVDNCIIETSSKTLIMGCNNSIIPDDGSVTNIGESAFTGCSGLTSITIPDSVTSIKSSAFWGCSGLTSIAIPDSVTSIEGEAFRYCSGLTSIAIPDSVTSIGSFAFFGCNALTIYCEVGSKPRGWDSNWNSGNCPVVWNCNTNKSDNNGNIYYIADNGIRYALNNGIATVIGQSTALSGEIIIPEQVRYNDMIYSITRISNNGFEDCSGLVSISIPSSVTNIGNKAFSHCDSLISMTIPFVGKTMKNHSDTQSYPFGYIFGDYGGDSTVKIFQEYCYSDTTKNFCIGKYTIPASLKSVTVTGGNILRGAFQNCSSLESITIPDNVTSIGDRAFYNCSGLKSITIPNSVTRIGDYAFYNCSGLTSITIPNSVTSIGRDSFKDCSRLTSITIGGSVTSIGDGAFSGCRSLTSITMPDSVAKIGGYAFSSCSGLTSITIPKSVTSIGYRAFDNCDNISEVYISDLAAWCKIGFGNSTANPLYYAHKLYLNGKLVTQIKIPEEVIFIGLCAFSGCSELSSVIIPDSAISIGKRAFEYCSGLTSIAIPNGVRSIGEEAFSDCSGLTNITIPNSVTHISDEVFSGCSGLTSITIPDSVTSIGEYAFDYCDNLTVITYMGTKEQWGKIKKEETWKDSNKKITVTCMDGVIVE